MKKKIIWCIAILILATPVFLVYLTFSNSNNCNQFVIDTYEIHSGIDIPNVDFVNCYYDEKSDTRISVYNLNSTIELGEFEQVNISSVPEVLQGFSLLGEAEQPSEKELYIASGSKWGTNWTYVVDVKSNRLWAELKY